MSNFKSIAQDTNGNWCPVRVGFLIWVIALSLSWTSLSIYNNQLKDIPPTVFHLTIALGATKVTHRLAENNWGTIARSIKHRLTNRKKQYKKSKKHKK